MATYQDFLDTLLPGNYALTKSMELTKIQSSGTLWYTKKFLVLYYYIFLSNDITTREYIRKVKEHFNRYIDSLDEEVQEDARNFFYPENESINFNSENFKTFSSFVGNIDFETPAEREEHYQKAKKCYFTLLMNSGGQTGVKRGLKEAIQSLEFVYSAQSIDEVLKSEAIRSAVFDANYEHKIRDNSIKYILSEEAMGQIVELSCRREVTIDDAAEIVEQFPSNNPRCGAIENDMVAFIRNERQILYYYGYFHSKSSGANDIEFSSLTPIGEVALVANAKEFLAIWEHQKIKMISQPVTVDINNVTLTTNNPDKFSISYSPYTDILGYLSRNTRMTLEEYQYIISRKNKLSNTHEWITIEDEVVENLESIKHITQSFNRRRDIMDEDSRKELLKYLLGIRGDLTMDHNNNCLNLVRWRNSTVSCEDITTLTFMYSVYEKLNDYKIQKHHELFERCEQDLRARYVASSGNNHMSLNPRVKIDWDLYNIHLDKFIFLGVILTIGMIHQGFAEIDDLTANDITILSNYCHANYSSVLRSLGLRSSFALKNEFSKIVNCIKENNYEVYMEIENYIGERDISRYRATSTEDLLTRIQTISDGANVSIVEGRERNTTLIDLLKSYYVQRYLGNNTLKCECCGEETFISENGYPYVEFHHLIPFSIAYGPDHYINLFALCPNCHMKLHHIKIDDKHLHYEKLNNNNYLHLRFVERLHILKESNLLRSYHLEYLLADNAITEDEYNSVAA